MDFNENKRKLPECYRVYLTTHTGLVRENNEDNFTINTVSKKLEYRNLSFDAVYEAPLVAAVFDGMGGEAKGEHAAFISAKLAKGLRNAVKMYPDKPINVLVGDYIQRANDGIRAFLEENYCQTGGTTVAAAIIKYGIIFPFSLGDSRIYLLRDSKLFQISHDHTLAMKKYEANIYTKEEADKSLDSHRLTAFLGADYYREGISPQYYEPVVMKKTDRLLLCSDGLYDELSPDEIQATMNKYPDNPALELVRAAIDHGGNDNVTCAVVEREY